MKQSADSQAAHGRTGRHAEHLKTAVLILLALSAVFFAYLSGSFREILPDFGGASAAGSQALESQYYELVRPVSIAVVSAQGKRTAAQYDAAERDLYYDRYAGAFASAIASIETFEGSNEQEYRRALGLPGVTMEYPYEYNIGLIARWLGVSLSIDSGIAARRITLLFDESMIYIQSSAYCMRASISRFFVPQPIADTSDTHIAYAFEADALSAAPYQLLFLDDAFPLYVLTNPLSVSSFDEAKLLAEFGVVATNLSYEDAYGARVFVTNLFTLSLDSRGIITYRRTSQPPDEIVADAQSLELAFKALSPLITRSGSARLMLTSVEHTDSGLVITANYYIGGSRIYLNEGDAARVTIDGGEITAMTLIVRQIAKQSTVSYQTLLPARQAIAAGGGEVSLSYSDSGGGFIIPYWRAVE